MKRYKDKKIIIFDVDGTIAESKRPLTEEMLSALKALLKEKKVAMISGAFLPIMKMQLGSLLEDKEYAKNLYLMPTSGSTFYAYRDGWNLEYALIFSPEEKKKVFEAFDEALKKAGFTVPEELHGVLVEDRDSQITFSAHGSAAPVELKKKWDPDQSKRKEIVAFLQPLLEEYQVTIAGSTSIDVSYKGVDKSYGARKLMEYGGFSVEDMLFFGDMIFPGGNDYPIHAMGVDSIRVTDHEHTRKLILDLLE